MKGLIYFFQKVAKAGTPEQTLATFYVYESQVPRVSQVKLLGLKTGTARTIRICARKSELCNSIAPHRHHSI
jgi:hypothetical protein